MALDPFSTTSGTALDPNVPTSGVTSVNMTSDPYGFNSINFNTSASSFAVQPAVAGPNLQVITPNSDIVQNRMVFSTIKGQSRLEKALTLRNTGSEALTIKELNFGDSQEKDKVIAGRLVDHERRDDFKFAKTVTLPITLAPGNFIKLPVQFSPKRIAKLSLNDSPTHTTNGENYASLTINSNDPDGPTKVNLAGINSTYIGGDNEAALAEIVRSFGWTTKVGSEDNRLGVTKTLLGDEVYSPYWIRADASKPVELWPVAVYSSPSDNTHDGVRFAAKAGSGGKSGFIYALAGRLQDDNVPGSNDYGGGENQKLLPKILVNGVNTTPTSSTVDFNPTSPFALVRQDGWTDDAMNGPNKTRGWRIYPLQDANGVVVPNTWTATCDIGTNVGRNGDFNDDVYLFKNARPESRALNPVVASSVSGSPELILTSKTYAGSRTNSTSTQLNKNDSYNPILSHQRSLLDMSPSSPDTSKGTNTVSISSNNTVINGLQTTFGGRASKAKLLTKLLEPLNNLNPGSRQGGIMLSHNDENYIKLVARTLLDGNLGLGSYAGGTSSLGSTVSDLIASNPLMNSLTALTPPSTGQSSEVVDSHGN